jgi:hypothetical protein
VCPKNGWLLTVSNKKNYFSDEDYKYEETGVLGFFFVKLWAKESGAKLKTIPTTCVSSSFLA